MKPRNIIIIVIFAFVLYLILTGQITIERSHPPGYQLVVDNPGPGDIVWSRDSQALFFKYGCIYRYDLKSGMKHRYVLPINVIREDLSYYDVSPDETKVIYTNGSKKIEMFDVNTGKIHLIYSSPQTNILGCWWFSGKRILFSLTAKEQKYDGDTYIVNIDGTHVRKIVNHIVPEYPDLQGNGFYYYPRNRGEYNIYYYDLINKGSARANRKIKTNRFNVSPDGKKEWVIDDGGHGDWYNSEPARLYIKDHQTHF